MTIMPTAPMSFRPARPAPEPATLPESRAVPPKLTLPSPTPRPALPAPTAKLALAAVTAHAGMTVDDLAPSFSSASARPRALTGAAIEQRFRYWYGRSGRRYLFSEVDRGEIADLDGVVLLVPDPAGTPGHVGLDPVACPAGGPVFVHLLAETEAERSTIVADLAPRAA